MRMTYATKIICDGCGLRVDVPQPDDDKWEQVKPEGWGLPEGVIFRGHFGQPYNDFCPTCMGDLGTVIVRLLDEEQKTT
jgi:hypothetical protein